MTEHSRDEILEELRNPCSAGPASIGQGTPVVNVQDSHCERWRRRMGRTLARQPFNIESEVVGSKSETNDFCRKRELVSAGEHVAVAVPGEQWVSVFASAHVVRRRGWRRRVFLDHDDCLSDPTPE